MSEKLFIPGQRWASETEPEIGLGIILKSGQGRVEVFFPAATEQRTYSIEGAPLVRIRLEPGDMFVSHEGEKFPIASITEKDGVLTYHGADQSAPEADLGDAINLNKPEDRLLAAQTDEPEAFALRMDALQRRHWIRQLRVRGFLGARIELLPHQLFIASEVARRPIPRVLLADEVGLGKTIEAGLILHRLHLTGRASRALILVPDSLVHQWYVELLRRFNLKFSIYDQERCESITAGADVNPFLDDQLILCGMSLFHENAEFIPLARDAGWDLLIVDEAHHLAWSEGDPSPEYTKVETIAAGSQGLLLLTGTPAQSGISGHFARLRLLDPARYVDETAFHAGSSRYAEVASVVRKLMDGTALTAGERKVFEGKPGRILKHLAEFDAAVAGAGIRLAREMVDEFGPGRVILRNTRTAIGGIQKREPRLAPLKADSSPPAAKAKWLANLCKELTGEKILVLCGTLAEAEATSEAVQAEIAVKTALFHEGMTLIQRDRNAAWFSEADGAQILICSGIGSEGRNFQFAHHVALLEIPQDPEIVEQRVGRLDRIGQTSTIHVHVPYMEGTREETLVRWLHEGINCFAEHIHGAAGIAAQLAPDLDSALQKFSKVKTNNLVKKTRTLAGKVNKELQAGHDQLLAVNSCRPEEVRPLIEEIQSIDASADLENFLLRILDPLGVDVETMPERGWILRPGSLMVDALPSLPPDGLTATFERTIALSRDDMAFMSWDHPLVRGALDAILGSTHGNATCVVRHGAPMQGLLLEVCFVIECVAPSSLHVDRFLPPQPIIVSVDHKGTVLSADVPGSDQPGNLNKLLSMPDFRQQVFPKMLRNASKSAQGQVKKAVDAAKMLMALVLDAEIGRLTDLQQINHSVTDAEIQLLKTQRQQIVEAIEAARLRTDCVRLIQLVS